MVLENWNALIANPVNVLKKEKETMKHLIILGILILSTPVLAGQEKQATPDTQAILERVDSAGEFVSSTLTTLAERLGTTVEYLWPTFVKEVYITGLARAMCGSLILLFSIIVSIFLLRLRNKLNYDWREVRRMASWSEGAVAAQVFAIVIPVIGIIAFSGLIVSGTVNMIAPEPQALKNISRAVGNLK